MSSLFKSANLAKFDTFNQKLNYDRRENNCKAGTTMPNQVKASPLILIDVADSKCVRLGISPSQNICPHFHISGEVTLPSLCNSYFIYKGNVLHLRKT